MCNPRRGQCLFLSAKTIECWAFVPFGKRIMEFERGMLVLYGDRDWMEENVITIPVYATMANHLCRPSLHLKKPDSKCCWIVGAQKPPLLRLPNQCLALTLRQEKRMSQSSLKKYVHVSIWTWMSAILAELAMCVFLIYTLLHKNLIFKMIHSQGRKQHYSEHKSCRHANIKITGW